MIKNKQGMQSMIIAFLVIIIIIFLYITSREYLFSQSLEIQNEIDKGSISVIVHDNVAIATVEVSILLDNNREHSTYLLTKFESYWTGIISDIPEGENRHVLVHAYDNNGERTYSMETYVDIIGNNVVTVILKPEPLFYSLDYNPYQPVIHGVTIFPDKVPPGETINMEASAFDRNSHDELFFSWSGDGGTFDDPHSSIVFWTAPSAGGKYSIAVNVCDSEGYSDEIVWTVEVDEKYGTDSIPYDVQCFSGWNWYYYYAPRIRFIDVDPVYVPRGGMVNLNVIVYDRSEYDLNYNWFTQCHGAFDVINKKDPVFTVSENACPGWYKMKVYVCNMYYCSLGIRWIKVIESGNSAPVITDITAVPSAIEPGEYIELTVDAYDSDGDVLTYSWTSECPGTFDNAEIRTPVFQAALDVSTGIYIMTITVSDGMKETSQDMEIQIIKPNTPPFIIVLSTTPEIIEPGGTTSLSLEAIDPNGDALTYSWSSDCPGEFDDPQSQNPDFTSNIDTSPGMYSIKALVSDGHDSTEKTITFTIEHTNGVPKIISINADPTRVAKGGEISLFVTATDPENDLLSYRWMATETGIFTNGDTNKPDFRLSDDVAYGECSFIVSVDDSHSTVRGSITIHIWDPTINIAPEIISSFQSTDEIEAGSQIIFRIRAKDQEDGRLSFEWLATEGIFGTPTYAEYEDYIENIIVWSAPSYSRNPVVVKVIISDPEGLSVVNDFLPITVIGGVAPNNDPLVEAKLVPAESVSASTAGYSVDVYGNRIITSFVTAEDRGAVAVFEIEGSDYQETAILHTPDQADKNYFGRSIAIDEDVIVVGAQMEDGGAGNSLKDCGAAYVYTRESGGVWSLKNVLYASDREMGDQFGSEVAINSGIITVSALYEDGGPGSPKENCGAVYVYERNEDNEWTETAILHGSDTMNNDFFGSSLAVDKNIVVVGAMNKKIGANLKQGCVYIFQKNDNNEWFEKSIIVSSDGQRGDYFGSSLGIAGNYIVIGAQREDGGGGDPSKDSGAVYIFKFDQQAENWILSSILRAPDNNPSDCYGTSVAVFSDIILISAAYDDGDPESGNTNSGALYAYRHLSNGVWSFLKKITSSDTQAYDYFGNSVAIHGNIAIAGAQGEDGGDGNPLKQRGAVYVIRF